jgi:tetratricopeptide (TPR) repeat protein
MKNSKNLLAVCVALVFCANPLKEKGPFWYNGYVYGTRGFSLYAEGKLDGAIASYRKALAEAQRLDIPKQAALYTFNIGRCWLELERYDSAIACFRGSYAEFAACPDSAAARQAAGFSALSYCELGNFDSAFAWYARAALGEGGKDERAFGLFIHGRLLWARDHGKEALTYFEEAYALYKKQKAYNAMAHMCLLRAGVYYHFGDFQESKKLIDEALSLSDKSNLRSNRFKILLAACSIYNRLNDGAAARRFFERAKNCAPSGGSPLPSFEDVQKVTKDLL